jgi:hypothetical protein
MAHPGSAIRPATADHGALGSLIRLNPLIFAVYYQHLSSVDTSGQYFNNFNRARVTVTPMSFREILLRKISPRSLE